MTFTEAAAQVLRLVGKPLHYKEITDVAIEKNLLSHVGKSPEVTMGARLAALVKKNDKDNPLVRVKPGVFALREWDKGTIDKGLADRTPALERIAALPPAEAEAAQVAVEAGAEDEEPDASSAPSYPEVEEEEARPPDQEELARAEMRAGATELFAPEADDDEPIFGAEEDAEDERLLDRDPNGPRRRRRRRRGGRTPDARGDDLPSYTVSDAPADLDVQVEAQGAERPARTIERPVPERQGDRETVERERPELRERGELRDRGDRGDRGEGRERDRDRGDRAAEARDRRDNRDRDRDEGRERGERGESRDRGAPLDELAGRDLADAVQQIIANFDRNRGLLGFQNLAEAAQRKGRANGDLQVTQSLIAATCRADNVRRSSQGQRQRFRVVGNRVGLTEWLLDGELLRLEREIISLTERYRETARRNLARKLQEIPHRPVGELVLLLLERLGVSELVPVRRTGAHGAELHLAGKLTAATGEMRVAIVVRRDGREIGRERVTELRGALHHYGPAHAGWLITTGQVLSGAREEASANGAAPVSLWDGQALAKLCEEHGIGVSFTRVNLPIPDVDLFDALRQA